MSSRTPKMWQLGQEQPQCNKSLCWAISSGWLSVCEAISGFPEINFSILVGTYLPKVRFPGKHQGKNEDRRNTTKPQHLRPEPSLVNAPGVNQQEFHFHRGNYAGDIVSGRGGSGVSPLAWLSFIPFYRERPQSC